MYTNSLVTKEYSEGGLLQYNFLFLFLKSYLETKSIETGVLMMFCDRILLVKQYNH